MLQNFYQSLPDDLSQEVFETLAGNGKVKIERIISQGHSTPVGEWYDQSQYEWVMLLKGEATLEFEQGETVTLTTGDYLTIQPHQQGPRQSLAVLGLVAKSGC